MKKITLLAAVLGVAMISCQKEEIFNDGNGNASAAEIVKILEVSDQEWTSDDVKSSYVPGTGIALSGSEYISVFYTKYDSSADKQAATGNKPVVATPGAEGKYTFSHNEVSGAESYNYFYVMPHHHTTESSGANRLFQVQFPGAQTYDQYYDYLLGEPSINVAKASSDVAIERFKRLTAPVNLVISDPEGLLEGESARVVTIDFENLAGPVSAVFVPEFSTSYAEVGISKTVGGTKSTGLTALYPDGLEPVGGAYNVWLSALPVSLSAGQKVSVTVSTETKTVTCEAALPSAYTLQTDKFNKIPFALSASKDGYAKTNTLVTSFTQMSRSTWKESGPSADLVASDGKSYTWQYAGTAFCYNTSGKYGLRESMGLFSNKSSLTLPTFAGKRVSTLRLYAHENSYSASSVTSEIVIKDGDTEVARKKFNMADMSDMTAGYVEFTGLESHSSLTVSYYTSDASTSHYAVISAAAVTLVDEPEDVPDDYYALWDAGEDVVFGDLVINKTNYPTATLLTPAEITYPKLSAGGLIFINDKEGTTASLTDYNTTKGIADSKALVLVGRYEGKHTTLEVCELRANTNDAVFVNLHLKTFSGATQSFAKNSATTTFTDLKFYDCFFEPVKQAIYQVNSTSACFRNIVFDNSVVKLVSAADTRLVAMNGQNRTYNEVSSVVIDNTLIYAETQCAGYVIWGQTSSATCNMPNLTVKVTGSTICGLTNTEAIFRPNELYSMQLSDLLIYANLTGSCRLWRVGAEPTVAGGEFSAKNIVMCSDGSKEWYFRNGDVCKMNPTQSGVLKKAVVPFTSDMNASKGYFPADPSVAGTAGATYSTKPWI